jgi:hypothetical protein
MEKQALPVFCAPFLKIESAISPYITGISETCIFLEFCTLRGEALADDSGSAIFPETGTVLRHPHRRHEGKSDVKTKD